MTDPKDHDLERVARTVLGGGLAVFPTETFYALGAHCMCEPALERIYRLKGRPQELPLLCLLSGIEDLEVVVQEVPPEARLLMERFWPGPLTLVLPARSGIPGPLVGPGGGVAVRWSPNPLAQALVSMVGAPLVGTSANLSGQPPAATLEEIPWAILGNVDAVLDGGRLPGGLASTVLDCTVRPLRILREGVLSRGELVSVVGLA